MVNKGHTIDPSGLYRNLSSIGGGYWQDCIQWIVVSELQSPLVTSVTRILHHKPSQLKSSQLQGQVEHGS
jgi:hypothetical protein